MLFAALYRQVPVMTGRTVLFHAGPRVVQKYVGRDIAVFGQEIKRIGSKRTFSLLKKGRRKEGNNVPPFPFM